VTETFAHAPGAVQYDYAQPVGARRQSLRGNLVGTTERMVGESGMIAQRSVYTAFGELAYQAGVGQTRYSYAGAWGYEAASGVSGYVDPLAELGWLHVGERYYDPASGRFMQRDPIGIEGGSNGYAYVENSPVDLIDPEGRSTWWPNSGRIRYGPSRPIGSAVKRIGFRVGTKGLHLFGAAGAATFVGSCVLAAGVGTGVGIGINYVVQATTGTSLSDRIGNQLWDWFGGGPPGYKPY